MTASITEPSRQTPVWGEYEVIVLGGGPLFAEWRAIVGPFFAQPPLVEHFTLVAKSDPQ